MNVKNILVLILYIFFLIDISISVIPKSGKRRYVKSTKQQKPIIPQGIYIDKLVTYDNKRKIFIDILNKNGIPTKRYQGGIFIEHIRSNGMIRYIPVHKLPDN
jgi:hypothetical protein